MNNFKNYIDISPLITEQIAVFPGDTPFSRSVNLEINEKCPVLLSNIKLTVHLGAHADAPNHYDVQGEDIAERCLDYYLGPCQVIDCTKTNNSLTIEKEDLAEEIVAPRILFKTNTFRDPYLWQDDFIALSAELVVMLARKNVKLIGIDTPSIDPAKSKTLCAHQQVSKNNMAILEGLILTDVEPGLYDLIALPLKIKDADASPVRAILVK